MRLKRYEGDLCGTCSFPHLEYTRFGNSKPQEFSHQPSAFFSLVYPSFAYTFLYETIAEFVLKPLLISKVASFLCPFKLVSVGEQAIEQHDDVVQN